jgi:hypothetical protein
MQQCPECERIYTDNTLTYCLDDGAALVPPFNLEATHINTPIPPTVALPTPTPKPRRGSRPMVLGLVALGVLIIGLLIGFWLSQRPNEPSANLASPTPTPVRPTQIKPTPTPVLVTEKATPTPSPLATPSPKNVESEPECMLYNDKADRSGVITRSDCDKKDCELDQSTKGKEYPDKTRVQVIKGSNVKGKRFIWVKVFLVVDKVTVWVATSKIKC